MKYLLILLLTGCASAPVVVTDNSYLIDKITKAEIEHKSNPTTETKKALASHSTACRDALIRQDMSVRKLTEMLAKEKEEHQKTLNTYQSAASKWKAFLILVGIIFAGAIARFVMKKL